MLFNSYVFIFIFLPVTVIGYYVINRVRDRKWGNLWLALASLFFCAAYGLSSIITFLAGLLINLALMYGMQQAAENTARRKSFFLAALVFNVLLLIGCKALGVNALGISFYTFTQISYIVDVYRGEQETMGAADYTLFMSFFPKLSQGPIAFYKDFDRWLKSDEVSSPNYDNLAKGLYAFSLGLGKKVLLADNLAKIVNYGFENYSGMNSTEIILSMVCYSLQIYFDFSGYCDMAYGIGLMLNIELPINFDSPYKADSIADFWQRWHQTLNRFFTKYIYIPLGGNRKGKLRTILNILIVFTISGFWHGLNLTFVLWGILNGIFVVIYRLFRPAIDRIPRFIRIPVTFSITTILWSIFRSPNITDSLQMIRRMFTAGLGSISPFIYNIVNESTEVRLLQAAGLRGIVEAYPTLLISGGTVVLIIAVWFMRNTKEKVEMFKSGILKGAVITALMITGIMSLSNVTEFIYYNF